MLTRFCAICMDFSLRYYSCMWTACEGGLATTYATAGVYSCSARSMRVKGEDENKEWRGQGEVMVRVRAR